MATDNAAAYSTTSVSIDGRIAYDNVLYHRQLSEACLSDSAALVPYPTPDLVLPALLAPTPHAATRVLEFFTAQVNNDHTRRAYWNAALRFSAWCAVVGIGELPKVRPVHVATYIKDLQQNLSAPSVKQHLAALRMLFDWLVTGHVIDSNPAHAVRGPRHSVKKGKTPVLTPDEARQLLVSIDTSTAIGLRDRALIALMAFTFARVSAALQMRICDYFIQGRRSWVRLHEKGGKEHEVPCHHTLDDALHAYIEGAGIGSDQQGLLFRSSANRAGTALTDRPLRQPDVWAMIRRRVLAAGIETQRIGCHSLRATGITAYMKNGGRLEVAQQIANHESPRTTKLYDRSADAISLDEIEKIVF